MYIASLATQALTTVILNNFQYLFESNRIKQKFDSIRFVRSSKHSSHSDLVGDKADVKCNLNKRTPTRLWICLCFKTFLIYLNKGCF